MIFTDISSADALCYDLRRAGCRADVITLGVGRWEVRWRE